MNEVNVIMPMLGGGTRMRGMQSTCKPLMRLPNGKHFFMRALDSLAAYRINYLILVVLPDYYAEFADMIWKIQQDFRTLGGVYVVAHDPTRTPVDTVRIGFNRLWKLRESALPLFVLDCDIYARIPPVSLRKDEGGRIFWFPSTNPNKSYINTVDAVGREGEARVTEIVEKRVISDKAVVGAYLFRDVEALRVLLQELPFVSYVSELFARMIAAGDRVRGVYATRVDTVTNYGTLEEYEENYGK